MNITPNPSRIGQLAKQYCDKTLPLEVMQSFAGFYIGTKDESGLSVSRESDQYWHTHAEATEALHTGRWVQKQYP